MLAKAFDRDGCIGAFRAADTGVASGHGPVAYGARHGKARANGLDDVFEGDATKEGGVTGAAEGCELVFSALGASPLPTFSWYTLPATRSSIGSIET